MKFTSEDLMKTMGLQIGDKVKIVGGTSYEVVLYNDILQIKGIENQGVLLNLYSLLNVEFEILPKPKRVGDLKCVNECKCTKCPIKTICNGAWETTLYKILDYWKDSDNFDQEIYDLLKTRLDKEVK